ncbi:hypothetical protein [Streptomyces sennicomposti]
MRATDRAAHRIEARPGAQLAYALEALGTTTDPPLRRPVTPEDENEALTALRHTADLARLLERRTALKVVRMRDQFGMSWRRIAEGLFADPEKHSTVRRMYDSGRRHLGC